MSSWPLNAIACRHRHRHQHPCRPALFAAPWCATLNEACRRACSGGLQGPAVTTSRLSSRFSALQGARYAATGRAGPATGSKPCLCGWAVCSAGWNGIHQMLVCYAPRMHASRFCCGESQSGGWRLKQGPPALRWHHAQPKASSAAAVSRWEGGAARAAQRCCTTLTLAGRERHTAGARGTHAGTAHVVVELPSSEVVSQQQTLKG